MSLVSLHSISVAFGGPSLLSAVSLDIHKGQRICFLGRNGAGKSTFMKIIAGEIPPDSGEIIKAPGLSIAYLPQDIPDSVEGRVFDVVASGVGAVGERLAQFLAMNPELSHTEQFHDLQHYLNQHNGWRIQTIVERVLNQTQLDGKADLATLSGGMRRRVFLARALVREPHLLLLDEPTNHLDMESIGWLESFMLTAKLTVLFVTHDRRLLRRIATRIIEIDRGLLIDWSCDYETFLQRKQALLNSEEKEWERFDKKLAQEEVWIRRGIKARRTRNEGRVRVLMGMRDERRRRRERTGAVSMTISEAQRSGDIIMEVEKVSFSYGSKQIITDFSACIVRGDRIGIIGPNGCGKTTLLNLLLGVVKPDQGTITLGVNLEVAYFDQLREYLEPDKTVWENVLPYGGDTVFVNGNPKHVISYLQDFLFTSDRAKSPVNQLSGGERNRLMLARMFTRKANVLVFDEPTNDLDTETLELLEDILIEFKGTVLMVSHDREFLNNVVTGTFVFEGNGIVHEYTGGYDDGEHQRIKDALSVQTQSGGKKKNAASKQQGTEKKKLTFKEKNELNSLPGTIEFLEMQYETLCTRMSDPAFLGKLEWLRGSKDTIRQIDQELATLFQRWEELEGRGEQ